MNNLAKTINRVLVKRALVLNANLASSAEVNTNGATDARFDVEVFAITGTNCTWTVEYYDYAKSAWMTLLAMAAFTTTGHKTIEVGLHQTTAGTTKLQCVLPRRLRITPVGSSLTSVESAVAVTLN